MIRPASAQMPLWASGGIITTPSAGKILTGYLAPELPTDGELNYLVNLLAQHVRYIAGALQGYEWDANTASGLNFPFKAGTVLLDNVLGATAAGTVALTDATTNYIETTFAGVVSTNTTGFTAGRRALYTVSTSGGTYSEAGINDFRFSTYSPVTPDASATVKGKTKLSTAPVSATDPIAVGDNDSRVGASGTFSVVHPSAKKLIQHGTVTTVGATATVTFPTAFGAAPSVVLTSNYNGTYSVIAQLDPASPPTTTQFICHTRKDDNSATNEVVNWIAIGTEP